MVEQSGQPLHSRRTMSVLLALAIILFIVALTILLYYWNVLVGIYQTTFILFGFLPSVVAFFTILCLWSRKSQEDAYQRFISSESKTRNPESDLKEEKPPT